MKQEIKLFTDKFKNGSGYDKILKLYLFGMLFCIAVFFVEFVIWAVKDNHVFALPVFHQNRNDAFMDFFNVNYFVAGAKNPYTHPDSVSSYPPLALLLAKFFAVFADYSAGSVSARLTFGGIFSLCLFFLIFFVGAFFALRKILKNTDFSGKVKNLLIFTILFSASMLFAFQRGNYLIYALLFVLIFFALYNSENKILREISYISLGAAFGIKLYPIAFGIMLYKDKRWFAIARLAVYCVLLFFLPFLAFEGGIDNFYVFYKNLTSFSAWLNPYFNYNLYQIYYSFLNIFSVSPITEQMANVSKIISYGLCALLVISAFLCEKKWQSLLAAALFMIYFTAPSFLYIGVMLIIPLIFFLAEKEKSATDYLVLFLFLIVMQPIYMGSIIEVVIKPTNRNVMSVNVFLQSIAVFALICCCIFYAVKSTIKRIKYKKRQL